MEILGTQTPIAIGVNKHQFRVGLLSLLSCHAHPLHWLRSLQRGTEISLYVEGTSEGPLLIYIFQILMYPIHDWGRLLSAIPPQLGMFYSQNKIRYFGSSIKCLILFQNRVCSWYQFNMSEGNMVPVFERSNVELLSHILNNLC